jgi:hypothetical protein
MTRTLSTFVSAALLLFASCSSKMKLPVDTSLGNLTNIEKKDKVNTNKDAVTPKSGEVVYVLSFEGKKEHEVKDVAVPELISLTGGLSDASDITFTDFALTAAPRMGSILNMPLVDSSGKEFAPSFFGSPQSDGSITNANVRFNGHVTGKDGKPWVRTGKLVFPDGKVTVVYVVPENSSFSLKDGAQKHSIN